MYYKERLRLLINYFLFSNLNVELDGPVGVFPDKGLCGIMKAIDRFALIISYFRMTTLGPYEIQIERSFRIARPIVLLKECDVL